MDKSSEDFHKAWVAVWLVVLLLECALVQLLQAESTDKVLGVELLIHSCDASSCDGLMAACTEGAPPCVVVRLAVWHALMLKKAPRSKGHTAFLQKEES